MRPHKGEKRYVQNANDVYYSKGLKFTEKSVAKSDTRYENLLPKGFWYLNRIFRFGFHELSRSFLRFLTTLNNFLNKF